MKLSLFWSTLALILATRRSCCEICSGFPAILIRAVKCNLCPTLRGGGGGADCDTFPLCEALIWAEAPEQRGWIRVPSPDTDAKRPFTTERPSVTNTSGCHPRGHARPNHSGQVVLTGVLLWLEYLCITIRWPVCRELRLTFFTILIPRIKPVILNSLNIIRNIRLKPVSTESKTADLYWTTPGGAK